MYSEKQTIEICKFNESRIVKYLRVYKKKSGGFIQFVGFFRYWVINALIEIHLFRVLMIVEM